MALRPKRSDIRDRRHLRNGADRRGRLCGRLRLAPQRTCVGEYHHRLFRPQGNAGNRRDHAAVGPVHRRSRGLCPVDQGVRVRESLHHRQSEHRAHLVLLFPGCRAAVLRAAPAGPVPDRTGSLERGRGSERGGGLMDGLTIAILGFVALFILLFIRMPVGLTMMLIGTVGIYLIRPQAAIPKLAGEIFNEAANFPLMIIPLFVLMGNLAGVSKMSRDLYDAANIWLGHFRGGLASATVVGCAGFSALSGSSLAAALTMGRVALPEMQRYRYHDGLATGAIAAGGTLGILIPPSAGFVIYAILTEESIGRLFLAGVLPGLLLTLLFVVAIWIVVVRNPEKAPSAAESASFSERIRVLGRAGWIIGIIVLTIGGIYTGIFSAIEAAGIGAALA
ncbi:MAG: TRAP transporter large permease subunit, partial [Alphaproteobacteria bacterium]|nr:TRAP transporter large permease subunit [Alphaproteobacteria bacterium]